MDQSLIVTYCIRLVLGGIAAFLAILLWSKTRAAGWMCLVASVLVDYAGIIYKMMIDLGIFNNEKISVAGYDILGLCFTAVPAVFLIAALVIFVKDHS
ncbi:MAG: hypothetical protein MJ169_07120 [Treponema sp.]|nr:hypothetical protein [Treponema sp.]